MEPAPHFRHEHKYLIGFAQYLALRSRLQAVMKPDCHAGGDGRYLIRSVYFDNYRDQALLEKINGAARREKFRIRCYNDDLSFLTLEKKLKLDELCQKRSQTLTPGQCRALLHGDTAWMQRHPSMLVRELGVKMDTQLLRPRVIVSYLREPYVFAPGNVRVTFDSDIRTSLFGHSFFENTVQSVCVSDTTGNIVLEVKYDAFLPDIIRCILQTGEARQQSFSKYGASRRFG